MCVLGICWTETMCCVVLWCIGNFRNTCMNENCKICHNKYLYEKTGIKRMKYFVLYIVSSSRRRTMLKRLVKCMRLCLLFVYIVSSRPYARCPFQIRYVKIHSFIRFRFSVGIWMVSPTAHRASGLLEIAIANNCKYEKSAYLN